jgi:hypothetical protein
MALFGTKSPPEPTVAAEMAVDMVEEGLVRVRFSGELDGPLVTKALEKLRVVVKGKRIRAFLVDGMAITKVDISMRGPSLELLALMKASGTTAGFVSTSSSVVRLVATTLGVASGIRIELLATTELALRKAQAALKSAKDAKDA